MKLFDKKCLPCSGSTVALSEIEAGNFLSQLDKWQFSVDKKWILKEFKFKDFAKTLSFVNKIGEVAEKENHHPNIEFTWGFCKISIQTHKINGLCEADFILAAKIDKVS